MTSASTENLSFCDALRAIKAGRRAQRAGWNGKGLFAFLQPGIVHGPHLGPQFQLTVEPMEDNGETIDGISVSLFNTNGAEHTAMRYPQLCLSFPSGTFGAWAPSQTDMLASDWIVEGATEVQKPAKEWVPVRRGRVVLGQSVRLRQALKNHMVGAIPGATKDTTEFLIDHPSFDLVEDGQQIPTYRAMWDDKVDDLVFERVKSQ